MPEPELPDVVECMEGWEWSDLYGKCVEKIDDDITVDTPEIETPDIDLPNVDIPTPSFSGGDHNFERQGLFDYTNIDVYKGTPLEPWKKELNIVRGMLS